MDYSIKKITDIDPTNIKNMNDNFEYLRLKLFEKVAQTPTTAAVTETEQPKLTVMDKIDFDNGCFINSFNDTIRIGCDSGDYIAIAKGAVYFYMGDDGAKGIADWTLKPDGLFDKNGKNVLDGTGGTIQFVPTFY
jgi:hypothetical protein